MSLFNSKSNTNYHVRSVSLPTRAHPTTIKIEQVLNNLKTPEPTCYNSNGEAICNKLCSLTELYEHIEELLSLQFTQQALSHHQPDTRVNELLEKSVKFIDICSNTRDAVMVIKQAIQDLQSSLRRRKIGDLDAENCVSRYVNSRKMIKKEIERGLSVLKQIEGRLISVSPPLSNLDDQFSATLQVLTETSVVTLSTIRSFLLFLSSPVSKSKTGTKWSLVSKLMPKSGDQKINKVMNEMETVDIALTDLLLDDSCKIDLAEKIKLTEKRLKVLETSIEGIEKALELLFRHLIRTRVSLLNIFSQ